MKVVHEFQLTSAETKTISLRFVANLAQEAQEKLFAQVIECFADQKQQKVARVI